MLTSSNLYRRISSAAARLLTPLAGFSLLAGTLPGVALVRASGFQHFSAGAGGRPAVISTKVRGRAPESFGRIPIGFETNAGQADARAKFIARCGGYTLFLTAAGAVMALRSSPPEAAGHGVKTATVLSMRLEGAARSAEAAGEGELNGRVNYFKGTEPGAWQSGVARYARVRYKSVYPGVDLVYHGEQGPLEYDFVVAPGADVRKIRLAFGGAERLEIDETGDLVLHTRAGTIRQHKPLIYQEAGGERRAVAGRYVRMGKRSVGFEVGPYDRGRELVIDPVISYSTYLGGAGFEMPAGVGVDAAGDIYVFGQTASMDFPVSANAFQKTDAGTTGQPVDLFVTKLHPAGQGTADLVYSTYLGGGGYDWPAQMATDAAGNVYLVGSGTAGFPATPNSYKQSFPGGFLLKLNPQGGLAYSTSVDGGPLDLAVGADGTAYVTGATFSLGFPLTPNALMPTPNQQNPITGVAGGFFMQRIRPAGAGQNDLLYSSYAHARRVAVDAAGNVYLADPVSGGTDPWPATPNAVQATRPKNDICYQDDKFGDQPCSDVYVEKLRPTGAGGYEVAYATYLGGQGFDGVIDIAVDRQGFIYLLGPTSSTPYSWLKVNTNLDDFPVTENAVQKKNNGGVDFFVSKINPNSKTGGAAGLVYSTFFGGRGKETPYALALGPDGSAYVAGETDSDNFVITANVLQAKYGGDLGNTISKPGGDGFLIKLNPAGSALDYSTYIGTSSGDGIRALAVDGAGDAYVTGYTWSGEFPVTGGAFQPKIGNDGSATPIDAFVTKVSERALPDAKAFAAGTGAFNVIDDSMSFVRQQYRDFLNREADDEGLAFWTKEITSCGADAQCREVKRINVSAAFFHSIEFQDNGYFFYRMNKAAFGEMPRLADFRAATQAIGRGVIVNQPGWEAKLASNRQAFVESWVAQEKFASRYSGMDNAAYVGALYANAGVTPAAQERDALVAGLNNGTETRASVLSKVADNPDFYRTEKSRAFVLAEYFGYLQRDPDSSPDSDLTGYNHWLRKLEGFGGDYVQAEMVKSFLDSIEYRKRFGPE